MGSDRIRQPEHRRLRAGGIRPSAVGPIGRRSDGATLRPAAATWTGATAKGWAMWRHQAGRIDFDGPLSRLWRRGWEFREFAPIVDGRDDDHWSVVGAHGGARVRGDRPERREAWAEAVRLALVAAVEHRSLLAALLSRTLGAFRHPSRSTGPSHRRDRHRHRSGARGRRGTGPEHLASRGGPGPASARTLQHFPDPTFLLGP